MPAPIRDLAADLFHLLNNCFSSGICDRFTIVFNFIAIAFLLLGELRALH